MSGSLAHLLRQPIHLSLQFTLVHRVERVAASVVVADAEGASLKHLGPGQRIGELLQRRCPLGFVLMSSCLALTLPATA